MRIVKAVIEVNSWQLIAIEEALRRLRRDTDTDAASLDALIMQVANTQLKESHIRLEVESCQKR